MYTLESLNNMNYRYNADHRLSQSDVDKANRFVALIENSRRTDKPMPGDILELTDEYGHYYANAHIECDSNYEENCLNVCEHAYIPFVSENEPEHSVSMSTSGGSWPQIPNSVKLIGQREKTFCVWGRWGPCANGAINFNATVNVWEYIAPNPKHGAYTTKDFDKAYVSLRNEPDKDSGYLIFLSHGGTSCGAFKTNFEYEVWKKTFKAVEFQGCSENQRVVFYYRHRQKPISKEEWQIMDAPVDTRLWNGSIVMCKFAYDDEKHELIDYCYADGQMKSGGYSAYYCADLELDWRSHKPYEYQWALMKGGN